MNNAISLILLQIDEIRGMKEMRKILYRVYSTECTSLSVSVHHRVFSTKVYSTDTEACSPPRHTPPRGPSYVFHRVYSSVLHHVYFTKVVHRVVHYLLHSVVHHVVHRIVHRVSVCISPLSLSIYTTVYSTVYSTMYFHHMYVLSVVTSVYLFFHMFLSTK